MAQNAALIPWTINPAIANAGVYQTFPELAALPRNTAEASVHGVNGLVNFTTRPNKVFGLTARYRFNDHRNLTPMFDAVEYVRFDAVPEDHRRFFEDLLPYHRSVDCVCTHAGLDQLSKDKLMPRTSRSAHRDNGGIAPPVT